MNDITITIHTEQVNERCATISLAGRLDARNAQTTKESLRQLIDRDINLLIVDLGQVSFIDSAGLASLVSALKSARRAEGNVMLSSVQPQARTVFSLTMLDQVFTIYPSLEAALESVTANG